MDVDFGKRLLGLREEKGKSREAAAKEIGIGLSSLQNYEKGSIPIPAKMEKILLYYKCDKAWLREGDPYPKSGIPETPAGPAYIKEGQATYPAGGEVPGRRFSIDEDLMIAASVLASKTHYATALHLNIRSFSSAITAETTMLKCQDELRVQGDLIAKMQARLDEMDKRNARFDELEKQNTDLLRENRELKKVAGDCPPIALTMEHAAPTGTDDPAA